MREQDSVAGYLVKAALHRIEHCPERVAAILQLSGLDAETVHTPGARLPAAAVSRFWLAMDAELQDEFFGFDSHGLPSGSFALICRALVQEATLGKALHQCFKYLGLFIRDIGGRLECRNGRASICLNSRLEKPALKGAAEEIYLSIVWGVMCWLVGRRIPLNRTAFSGAAPVADEIPWHWGPLVEFQQAQTELFFDAAHLHLPVIQTPASLRGFLRSCPQWLVVRFRNEGSLAARVFSHLHAHDSAHWPTLQSLAKSFSLSEQAFRRQLAKEGFSYQEIKHEVRRSIIFVLLRDPTISISEVAVQAGFQEPSAFHRIFRRWTGESPGQFRARALQQGTN